jgi:hypothetical protein
MKETKVKGKNLQNRRDVSICLGKTKVKRKSTKIKKWKQK